MNQKTSKRPTWARAFLRRYGIPPWLILPVFVIVLLFGICVYVVGRGRNWNIPAPAGLNLPVAPPP